MIATIDLGGTRTKFGLVDGEGTVVRHGHCDADARGSLRGHLEHVVGRLEDLCRDLAMPLSGCRGLGLLATGLVDSSAMRVLSTNGKYDDAPGFDFAGWARTRTGLELRIENDARGALLGESNYGAGRGARNLVMLTIGTGIGTAVLADGRLLRGAHASGGNLGGHMIVRSGGRRCTCGGRGCMESEASGWSLPLVVREHPEFPRSSLRGLPTFGFRELIHHANEGDDCAIQVFAHCLRVWGEGIVSLLHLFDPEKVIVGGGLMHCSEPVLASFRRTVSELAWPHARGVEIVAAAHPSNAGLIGAGALFPDRPPAAKNDRETRKFGRTLPPASPTGAGRND